MQVKVHEVPVIYSNQEETDTRVVLYLHHAAALGYHDAVVRTPDTDIFVILLFHAHKINLTVHLDTGSGKHRQVINVTEQAEILGERYCAALLGLYIWTGEDCTSAFRGKAKVGPLKKLEKNPRFQQAFERLGENWVLDPDVHTMLEQFGCLLYGHRREKSINSVRSKMLRKMVGEGKKLTTKSKVDLARLPPCCASLQPHNNRANHRACLYKRADEAIVEKPKPYEDGQGWRKTDEGVLEPVWTLGPILPTSLIDLLEARVEENKKMEEEDGEEEEEEEDMEFDSDTFASDSDEDY